MHAPVKFPIALKLTLMIVLILLVAMAYTTIQASRVIKDSSGKREEGSNRDLADARANQVAVILENIERKAVFFGSLLLRNKSQQDKFLLASFKNDPDFISLQVYALENNKLRLKSRLLNEDVFRSRQMKTSYLLSLNARQVFPTGKVFSGIKLIRNRSRKGGLPLFTIGVPLVQDQTGKVSHIVVADIHPTSIQVAFSERSVRTVYLIDGTGSIFAHPNEQLVISNMKMSSSPAVKKAIASQVSKGQLRYYDSKQREHYVSAFSKTAFNLIVISDAPESLILEPAEVVQKEIIYVALLVVSASLFLIVLFSISITGPIKKLVLVTREIARGNFEIPVANIVPSKDEVGTLAIAFDTMLGGLRERDKVKTLFNKFHGSSVTDNLLAQETIGITGVRKEVVVFFSDIRGFTAISENAAPEDVVNMVNEYFQAMVQVIMRYHGIVDKFIGDAIMAIWGAPRSTGHDSYYAVMACLEMRAALNRLNELRISRGEQPLLIGMGLHFGEAISGTIGSDERMEYTVIGDTVNMASRIEASTKAFGTDLLISENVYAQVQSYFITEEAGSAKVKGKSDHLKFFKVLGYHDHAGQTHIVRTPYSEYAAEKADKVDVVI